ncbi:MAG: flagellar basal body rod protein FlgB [Myxococcales bacterium]|nr:flagellar basal body rod protein FlgB [Myxococcales bacterium]
MSLIFDRLSSTMQHAMNYRLQRHNMISANLANIDTPGYTPVEIKFDEQLRSHYENTKPQTATTRGLTATHGSHFTKSDPIEQADVEFDAYSLPDKKGNSVDMDHESSKLAQNQLMYRTLITAYNKRMSFLQYTISGGR